jgi:hypothetical protein
MAHLSGSGTDPIIATRLAYTDANERAVVLKAVTRWQEGDVLTAADELAEYLSQGGTKTCVSRVILAAIDLSLDRIDAAYRGTRDSFGCGSSKTRVGLTAEAMRSRQYSSEFFDAWATGDPHESDIARLKYLHAEDRLERSRALDVEEHRWDIVDRILRDPSDVSQWQFLWAVTNNRRRHKVLSDTITYVRSRRGNRAATAWLVSGALELSLGHEKQAERAFERARKLDPGNPDVIAGLLLTAAIRHRRRDGEQYFLDLQRIDPRTAAFINEPELRTCLHGRTYCALGSITSENAPGLIFMAWDTAWSRGRDSGDAIRRYAYAEAGRAVKYAAAEVAIVRGLLHDTTERQEFRLRMLDRIAQQLSAELASETARREELAASVIRIEERGAEIARQLLAVQRDGRRVKRAIEQLHHDLVLIKSEAEGTHYELLLTQQQTARLSLRLAGAEELLRTSNKHVLQLLAKRDSIIIASLNELATSAAELLTKIPTSVGNKGRTALENLTRWSERSDQELVGDLWTVMRQVMTVEPSFYGFGIDIMGLVELLLDIE